MATRLKTELVLDALDMALWQRQPVAVIHHSDQGMQYTSIAFGLRCKQAGVRPSMGSVGDAYDNAMCESFFATLECELLDQCRFRTQAEARLAVFGFIEGWYNPRRRHSALGYLSPLNFERQRTQLTGAVADFEAESCVYGRISDDPARPRGKLSSPREWEQLKEPHYSPVHGNGAGPDSVLRGLSCRFELGGAE